MDLTFIHKKERDDEGDLYDIYILVDRDSERSFGYVETPTAKQISYVAVPYEGQQRWYIALDPAKAYLESVAIKQDADERAAFCKANEEKNDAPKPTRWEKIQAKVHSLFFA